MPSLLHIILLVIAFMVSMTCFPIPNYQLYKAAKEGQTSQVGRLLDWGANVNWTAPTFWGQTSLHACCGAINHPETAELLLGRGADPNARRSTFGSTPLGMAAVAGQVEMVRLLLANGADPNVSDTRGGATPLLLCCAGRGPVIMGGEAHGSHVSDERIVAVATMLLAAGADVHAVNSDGETPVVHAAARGLLPLVELLLAHGADGESAVDHARVHCPPPSR